MEPIELNNEYCEGHGETEAPDGRGPVSCGSLLSGPAGHQEDGHTHGEQLRQVEAEAHDGHDVQVRGCPPGGLGAVMVRQVTVPSTAVVFPEDPPEKGPALEVKRVRRLEEVQGPVMAEALDLWSSSQWPRHSGSSLVAQW